MIWAIVSKDEMENYKIPPAFKYYREVIGKDNISLAVVDESDGLNFVDKDNDIVLLRSANKELIKKIKDNKLKSTSEEYYIYETVADKKLVANLFDKTTIKVPKQFTESDIEDGKKYFVKPRFGSESFGITKDCLCSSKAEVQKQVQRIKDECNQESVIEEFIEGVDCTVAFAWNKDSELEIYAIKVENDEVGGIQTHKGKFDEDEYCSPLNKEGKGKISEITKLVVELIGIKRHGRIDFRLDKNENFYLIDVNLMPGMGITDHFAKCMLLDGNKSYKTAIWTIINSAMAKN